MCRHICLAYIYYDRSIHILDYDIVVSLHLKLRFFIASAKSKTLSGRSSDSLSGNQNIRRTASLDTIYLKGQWPRDAYYIHPSLLLVDKSTQVIHI